MGSGHPRRVFAPTYRRYLTPTTPPLNAEEQRQRTATLRAAFRMNPTRPPVDFASLWSYSPATTRVPSFVRLPETEV
jgi:hypothetical protein